MPAGHEPPTALLEEFCAVLVATLPVDYASVAVANQVGHWGVAYASHPIAAELEDLAFTLGDGPCVEAFRSGLNVLVSDLDSVQGHRWPVYAAGALDAHCRAAFAFPMRIASISLGCLALYASSPATLHRGHLELVAATTPPLTRALVEHANHFLRPSAHADVTADAGAPFLRSQVYQAAGMVTVQLEVTIAEAMIRLRAHAFAHDRSINDVAHDIVGRTLRLSADPR